MNSSKIAASFDYLMHVVNTRLPGLYKSAAPLQSRFCDGCRVTVDAFSKARTFRLHAMRCIRRALYNSRDWYAAKHELEAAAFYLGCAEICDL